MTSQRTRVVASGSGQHDASMPGAGPPAGEATGVPELRERMARAERANRRLWGTVVLLASLGALSAVQGAPDPVQVQGLEMLDDQGRVRAALVLEDGQPAFHLLDESGVRRVSLVSNTEEAALFLQDPEGDTRLGAAHFSHGGSGYALHGPGGEGALVLYLKENGTLTSYGASGEVLARFPQD